MRISAVQTPHGGTAASPRGGLEAECAICPGPLFAQDLHKALKGQTVEWIRGELDAGASLEEFAAVYVRLLADKTCAKVRRRLRLELCRLFNPTSTVAKEWLILHVV